MRIFPPLPGENHIQKFYITREENAKTKHLNQSKFKHSIALILCANMILCFYNHYSPHMIPNNIAKKWSIGTRPKDVQGKGQCASYRIRHLYQRARCIEQGAELFRTLSRLPVSMKPQSSGLIYQPVKEIQNKHTTTNPTKFLYESRVARKHVKWMQWNDGLILFNYILQRHTNFGMISTLPWSQGLQNVLLAMLTQTGNRGENKEWQRGFKYGPRLHWKAIRHTFWHRYNPISDGYRLVS
jgi:hypothetical protein